MSGITFDATFPLVFEVRTAPPVDSTDVTQLGDNVSLTPVGGDAAVSQQATSVAGVTHQ